jgi:splicing factor 3B subunit 2
MPAAVNGGLMTAGGAKIKSKNQLRRAKAKQKKATTTSAAPVRAWSCADRADDADGLSQEDVEFKAEEATDVKPKLEDEDMAVDYVSERLDVSDAALEAFSDVFARFQLPPELSAVRLPPKIRSLVSLN